MCQLSLIIWSAFLLVTSTEAIMSGSSTSGDGQDDSIQYEPNTNSTATRDEVDFARYKLTGNSTIDGNSVQYEFRSNTTGNDDRNNDEKTRYVFRAHSAENHVGKKNETPPYELRANSTKTITENNSTKTTSKNNSTSKNVYELGPGSVVEDDVAKEIVSYEMCDSDSVCIPVCCAHGERLFEEKCVPDKGDYSLPYVYENVSSQSNKTLDKVFKLVAQDPCQISGRFRLNPVEYPDDEYMFLTNGSLYKPRQNQFIQPVSYCLAVIGDDKYDVTICFPLESNTVSEDSPPGIHVGIIVSLPFLLITFLIYSVLPELWNMHGYTLRGYVGSLFVAYLVLAVMQLTPQEAISISACIALAFIIHFSFLASFFWLNVMCFDIWWTFGGFRSLQGSIKQRERKKFIMYSIYAWGSASILTIVCAIMDFVPSVPKNLIRPEFGAERCWFTTDAAKAVYFYGPMGVTVICNICLFISTALKIVRHRNDTAHHLRGPESRRHDDNKQWFNLYLKLFIVMGINWSMEIISWLFKSAPPYVWYLTDLTNTLQGLIIFIIFVWKEKIKRLLLKRFGCQERGLFSRNSTRSGYHSSTSRTCTTGYWSNTSGVIPLQEKISSSVQTNCRAKSSSDETECP